MSGEKLPPMKLKNQSLPKLFEKKLVRFNSDTENEMKAVHKELYEELFPKTLPCLLCFLCTAHGACDLSLTCTEV